MLIHKDEDGYCHYHYLRPRLDKTLHIYPELDLAIITLSNEFYGGDSKYFLHPDQHTKPSIKPKRLGHDAAILGYPLQELRMTDKDIDFSDICLRADRGVVNQRVDKTSGKRYEFTIPFNPGNSGGPVFDTVTGDVFAMVQGYKRYRLSSLNARDADPQDGSDKVRSSNQSQPASTRYSVATSLQSLEKPLRDHGII